MKLCIFITITTVYSCMSLVRSNMLLNKEAGCTVNITSGVSMMNFHISPFFFQKFENLHYGLWQLQTAITWAYLKLEARRCTKVGVFGVGQYNGVVEICLRPTLVTKSNQLTIFKQKIGQSQLRQFFVEPSST